MQLFRGVLTQRCMVNPDLTPAQLATIDPRILSEDPDVRENTIAGGGIDFRLCSTMPGCSNSSGTCYQCPEYTTCTERAGPNPYHSGGVGFQNFDNFYYSMLTVFCEVTGSNWTILVYMIARSYGSFVYWYFFVLLVILSYFAVNLVIAVIGDSLGEAEDENGEDNEYDVDQGDYETLLVRSHSRPSSGVC